MNLKELLAAVNPNEWHAAQGHVTAAESEDFPAVDINCHGGNRENAKHQARLIAAAVNMVRAIESAELPLQHDFVVKHYGDDPHPTIKGNGFDGLVVGNYRDEAQAFIDEVNALRIAAVAVAARNKVLLDIVSRLGVYLPTELQPEVNEALKGARV